MPQRPLAPASLAAQGLGWIEPTTKAIVSPIHASSTFQRDDDNQFRSGRVYARADNPTFDQVEATVTSLEHGVAGLVFSSGMAAATACFQALEPGHHVIAPTVMYSALRNWLATFATRWGLAVSFVDTTDLAAVASDRTRPRLRALLGEQISTLPKLSDALGRRYFALTEKEPRWVRSGTRLQG